MSFNKYIGQYSDKLKYSYNIDKKTSKILAEDEKRKLINLLVKKPLNS